MVYLEIDTATNASAAAGVYYLHWHHVSSHPEIKMVITDHGNLTGTIQTFLQAAGKKPGDVFAAGFDILRQCRYRHQGGWLQLVIDQQQCLQGYFGVLQICLTKVYGFSGLYINTGAGFVNKDNVAVIAPLAAKNIR